MSAKKKLNKTQIKVLSCIIGGCLILGLAGAELFKYFGPNSSYTDMLSYLGLTGSDEWAFVCNTENMLPAINQNGKIFLPLEAVNESISSRFYYDESRGSLIVVKPDGITESIMGSDDFISLNKKPYVSTGFVERNYPCTINEDNVNRIVNIWSDFEHEHSKRMCTTDVKMRVSSGIRGEIVCDLKENDELIILSSEGDYSYCMTNAGLKGYVKTKDLSDITPFKPVYSGALRESFSQISAGRLVMGWHMLDTYTFETQTERLSELLVSEPGLNVVSPTWYSVKTEAGEYTDNSSKEYVDLAHSKGIQVWGLVDNFSAEMNNLNLLKDYSRRTTLVEKLVNSALECGMDGINMDFESSGSELGGLNKECGPHYVQFLRELTYAAHQKGLIVSVDVPVPFSFNSYFDREELGRVVDYVIIMGYDEHYAGSEPGSVASYDFVNDGLKKTLDEVPAERTVLGVPFYTRQWTVDEAGNIIGTRDKTEKDIEADIVTYGANPVWHDTEKQFYAEFYNEYGLVRVWLDDAESLKWKMELIKQYGIAGAAAWRLGAETESMWQVYTAY